MKLKDILNMEDYLKNECYCPGEIYSIDGFFYQIFRANEECKVIIENKEYNNSLSKIPCLVVISKSTDDIVQLLIVMYEKNKIVDIVRFDATENNIKLIKEILETGKTNLKWNEYPETKTKESLEKIFNIVDAIMVN